MFSLSWNVTMYDIILHLDPGVKSRMCPPYPHACRKRRLNGAVSRNNRIKRLALCQCLDGHVKEPYEMYMALGARP